MGTKTFKDLTTLGVGGKIKYYREVKNRKEVVDAVSFAKKNNLPIFIIGGGSDILVSDKDFDGVVIKFTGDKFSFKGEKVTAESGMEWDKLVEEAVKRNLQGIESLSGIPGTVGAAPIQNIGAYGQELKETFVTLTAYDVQKEKFVVFSNKDCGFSYRESIFKRLNNWQKFIITDIVLRLRKGGRASAKYESLKDYVPVNPTLAEVRDAVLRVRRQKLEDPKQVGNAGSFFKNPIVSPKEKLRLEKQFPGIKIFAFGSEFKISAGWLIESTGWKGRVYKNAAVSAKHALILINPKGKAKANEILELSEKIIDDVYKKFGVGLEREVQLVNFSKTAILGYGLEGQDLEKFLKKRGAEIEILDKKFGKNYLDGLSRFDVIYRSPGVYRFLPKIVAAEKAGVKISSAIKLFSEECPGKIIGVTGTKGKGTTSTLIYEILKKAGYDVYLAGNIGKPYLELLPKLTKDSFVVMEMSSFQLIDMNISPHIAVVLNITSDHMDWHKSQKEYVDAKKNIVAHQKGSDYTVINKEYETPKSFVKDTKANMVLFSKKDLETRYKEKLLLRGEHNFENVAAAVSVAKILKIDDKTILGVLRNFKGLEHRLELVREVNGVGYYNDSFATSPQPTIAAINSFAQPETLILGGSDKGLDYVELGEVISSKANVQNVILIGAIRRKIGKYIKNKKIFDLGRASMSEIVRKACEVTPKGGVVILSPAAASFDMFENYKDRGNQFKKVVLDL